MSVVNEQTLCVVDRDRVRRRRVDDLRGVIADGLSDRVWKSSATQDHVKPEQELWSYYVPRIVIAVENINEGVSYGNPSGQLRIPNRLGFRVPASWPGRPLHTCRNTVSDTLSQRLRYGIVPKQ